MTQRLPRVVKVSGGRSSALMLMRLLKAGELCHTKGDVAMFANTSAEHPATYEFIARLAEITNSYGVEFACLEWVPMRTKRGVRSGFRLVKPVDMDKSGRLFEGMISYKGFPPNVIRRFCTHYLKIEVAERFCEWRYHGKDPFALALVRRPPPFHPQDPKRKVINELLVEPFPILPPKMQWEWSGEWLNLYGFRSDERHRVARAKARADEMDYQVEFPLANWAGFRADKPAVFKYWGEQRNSPGGFDLDLPNNEAGQARSNCVFCHLKTGSMLRMLARDCLPDNLKNTPSDIKWWQRLQETYAYADNPKAAFSQQFTYKEISETKNKQGDFVAVGERMPCECMD